MELVAVTHACEENGLINHEGQTRAVSAMIYSLSNPQQSVDLRTSAARYSATSAIGCKSII